MSPLTPERLREVLRYDPETGEWTWLVARPNGVRPGDKAGCVNALGYRILCIDNRYYKAGRVACLYMTGAWPPQMVDHKDRNPRNDRWENLRPATPRENIVNRGLNRNNTSGYKGVHWYPKTQKWRACVCDNYRKISLGLHNSKEEAHRAYLDYYSTR